MVGVEKGTFKFQFLMWFKQHKIRPSSVPERTDS